MRWLNWNYSRQIILKLIHAALLALLLFPWLQLAAQKWHFNLVQVVLWCFLSVILQIILLQKALGRGRYGWMFIALAVLLPFGAAILLGLPLYIAFPIVLGLNLMGLRFPAYPRRANFATDWAFASLTLIIFASLERVLAIQVPVSLVLSFFALGIVGVIVWNSQKLEQQGLQPDYRGLGRSILVFIAVVIILALSLGGLLSPRLLQGVVYFAKAIYFACLELFSIIILRPFAWLLSPLFRWAESMEGWEISNNLEGLSRFSEELQEGQRSFTLATSEAASPLGWMFFVVALGFSLVMLVRKLLKLSTREQVEPSKETRESVFSSAELLSDLKTAFQQIITPLTRIRRRKWYQGDDPLLVIRTLYARFAIRASRKIHWPRGSTPAEYVYVLRKSGEELNLEATEVLTKIYNQARYGEIAELSDVNSAKKAFQDIWQ